MFFLRFWIFLLTWLPYTDSVSALPDDPLLRCTGFCDLLTELDTVDDIHFLERNLEARTQYTMNCIYCSTIIGPYEQFYLSYEINEELQDILTELRSDHEIFGEHICGTCFNYALLQLQQMSLISAPVNCIYCRAIINNDGNQYLASEVGEELRMILGEFNDHEIVGEHICGGCIENAVAQLHQQNTAEREVEVRHICICCTIEIDANEQFYLLSEMADELRNTLGELRVLEPLNEHIICEVCFNRAMEQLQQLNNVRVLVENPAADPDNQNARIPEIENPVVDLHHCISCLRSIRGRQFHNLLEGPEHERIAARIHPRQIYPGHRVCHRCWMMARNNTNNVTVLPNYRHSRNASTCFVTDCQNGERLRLPKELKKRILQSCKLFITRDARICRQHLLTNDWLFLNGLDYSNAFTPLQVEEMVDLLTDGDDNSNIISLFEDFGTLEESTSKYWTALNKENFLRILDQTPSLRRFTCPNIALAIYLIKLRTGDSNARIALLCNSKSEAYVSRICKKVRACLKQEFVPQHLGLDHLPRDRLIEKNLMIPEGLFGDRNAGDNRPPITICDGTYIYIQKSANLLYQRKSFSPHKHTNLVKAFMMVATDGHIIDIFGPFAATASDAQITRRLFRANGELQRYYREGDVFILDRGFRDAIPMLRSLNYHVFVPETRQANETQLSTLSANRSRWVTLCRWVVEIVNGRFKRDFKIFRQVFFNAAATHLMDDFKIAGAIINAFHLVITDRIDAAQILDRALRRLNMPNILADYVISNNFNRRRTGFVRIDGNIPGLDVFPVMTMSQLILFALGTYQIKMARSYYGEHIRGNGRFTVEILNNVGPIYIPGIAVRGARIIRCRLHSRFHNNKLHYCYILIDPNADHWDQRINSYYCSCHVGKRTVGCCAHVMTIVWYLGWARHQENITAPAPHLDTILVE